MSIYNSNTNMLRVVNSLPWAVTLVLILIGGIELIFQLAENGFLNANQSIGLRLDWGRKFGYYDPLFEWMHTTGHYRADEVIRIVTYPFIQMDIIQALFVIVFIAALGKFVAERCGNGLFLMVFFISSAFGALGYGLILNENILLIGAYTGVYGLIGAFTWLQFIGQRKNGQSGARAFTLIGFFVAMPLAYTFIYGGNYQWISEFIGFVVGFLWVIIFGPGVMQRYQLLRLRLRQRS